MSEIEELKKKLKAKKKEVVAASRGLSTGQTLLNLAMTGSTEWGFDRGCYYLLVGKSSSGKTFIALNALAEAANSPHFSHYRLIYDAPERGARMSMEKFFGKTMAERLEWRYSKTVEEFYYNLDDAVKKGDPFIYVEDSESSLDSEDAEVKFEEQKAAHRKGKDAAGSYGDGKAKKHSSNLRRVVSQLDKTGSILLLISQSRDNIGFGAQFNPETRGGGRALTFYATAEIWFSPLEKLKATYKGKAFKSGSVLQAKVKKNRDTGFETAVDLYHYISHGFDDTQACVEFLVEMKRWPKEKGGKIEAHDLGMQGTVENLIREIEDNNREEELRAVVGEVWKEIEVACTVQRKKRYA